MVLGVPPSATLAEVKGAYRRLVHRYHPDRNPRDPAASIRFRSIVEAYELLRDPGAREAYDRDGTDPRATATRPARTAAPTDPAPGPTPSTWGKAFRTPPRSWTHGKPVLASATITLAEVLTGTERTLQLDRDDACDACRGSGAAPGHGWIACRACGGRGRRVQGRVHAAAPCSTCRGQGRVLPYPCAACEGRTLIRTPVTLRVKIPAGMDSGGIIRFNEQGHAGAFNAPRGSLRLRVEVEPHPTVGRDGADLWLTVPLTPAQAALGAVLDVTSLEGPVRLRVRPGTQPGTLVRVRRKGLPVGPGMRTRGDCHIRLTVVIPQRLSTEERALFEALARLGEPDRRFALSNRLRRWWRRPRA